MNEKYMKWECPECGTILEIKVEDPIQVSFPPTPQDWVYERIELIRHCPNCLTDWKNIYSYEFGDISETQLQRHFWG